MRIYPLLVALVAFGCTLSTTGCRSTAGPEKILQSVVFPYEWVGDIDQIEFNEPSGICWHAQRGTLFVVGDEGDLCEIKPDGELVSSKHIRDADFEGITYDPATGLLYLAIEEEAILEVDPGTLDVMREFSLPRDFQGKTRLRAGGEGLEGITFVPDPQHAEGGLFYVANQAFTLDDPEDISAIFEVEVPLRTRRGKPRITGCTMPGIIDLSGLNYDATTDRILAISDATNLILEYSRDMDLLSVQAFPGDNQEGVTVDPAGYIYIAQDTGGILKLKWLR
jgi:uncharacterized protein YjiK